MSQMEHGGFEAVESKVIDALGEFDKNRSELYDALAEIAVEAQDESEYQLGIAEKITATALAMQDLAYELLKADGIDGSKEQLARLWQTDDEERVKTFRDLVGCVNDCFDGLDAENAAAMIDELYEEAEDESSLSEEIYDKYRAYLAGDVFILAGHIQNKHDSEPVVVDAERPIKYLTVDVHEVRKAALSMASVALGVAGGLALDRLIRKRS